MTKLAIPFAAVLVGLYASSAAAQQSAEDRARQLLAEAQAHEDGERYALAAERFEQLYDAMREAQHPRAPIALWSMGYNLRRIPGREHEAIAALRRFLDESTTLTDDPEVQGFRSESVSIIAELEARVPQQEPEPEAELEPEESHMAPRPDAVETTSQPSPLGPVIMATGGASLLVGVIVGAFSLSLDSDFRGACGDLTMCPSRLRPQYDEMRTYSIAADVLLVAGGIAAALGLVLTLTVTEEADVSASATCNTDGCFAVAQGSF